MNRRELVLSTAKAALLGGLSEVWQSSAAHAEDEGTIAIAEQAYIYGFPMIAAYKALYQFNVDKSSGQYKASFNEIWSDARLMTPADTAIVTPNADTPYSLVQLDLRAEPIVLSVPEIEQGRYYAVQLADMYSFNYGYIGSRTTGNGVGGFMVAGPGWQGEMPAGINKVFRSETEFGLVIYRTQLFSPADMVNVKKIQSGYKLQTLSAYLGQPAPPAAPPIDWPPYSIAAFKGDFPAYLNFLLQFCPEVPEETALRAQFATIGIGPGRKFAFQSLSIVRRAEILLGVKRGFDKIEYAANHIGKVINGWGVGAAAGSRAFFHGDWLLRAGGAKAGIYGNDADEAMYPYARNDSEGQPLDGSVNTYRLTFAAGQFPPVNAFWSVTMYDGKSQLLVANPINRYLINSTMLPGMRRNPDGSLTIHIQKDQPGADDQSNWLPAPDGPIFLVMRLYWPKTTPPSILPPGSGTWSPPPVLRAD